MKPPINRAQARFNLRYAFKLACKKKTVEEGYEKLIEVAERYVQE